VYHAGVAVENINFYFLLFRGPVGGVLRTDFREKNYFPVSVVSRDCRAHAAVEAANFRGFVGCFVRSDTDCARRMKNATVKNLAAGTAHDRRCRVCCGLRGASCGHAILGSRFPFRFVRTTSAAPRRASRVFWRRARRFPRESRSAVPQEASACTEKEFARVCRLCAVSCRRATCTVASGLGVFARQYRRSGSNLSYVRPRASAALPPTAGSPCSKSRIAQLAPSAHLPAPAARSS
jgi:hypothetical protein